MFHKRVKCKVNKINRIDGINRVDRIKLVGKFQGYLDRKFRTVVYVRQRTSEGYLLHSHSIILHDSCTQTGIISLAAK